MILYEGPSLLDPAVEIVAIATEDSNPKTGRMLYTWIFRADRAPEVAAYDGSDAAICGDCKFRAVLPTSWVGNAAKDTRTCYVRLSPAEGADEAMPPSEVWRAWKAGEFEDYCIGDWDWIPRGWPGEQGYVAYRGPLPVRIGSYGDPAAVPTRVWAELVRYQKHWTGYTHMWRQYMHGERINEPSCGTDLRAYCMASVDTPEERAEAQALGWRTFFVMPTFVGGVDIKKLAVGHADILCPATDPHPKRNTTCSTCLLCRGTSAPAPSIWEVAHGTNKENHQW